MTRSSISNPPTSFPTEEMRQSGAKALCELMGGKWLKRPDRALFLQRVDVVFEAAMHKASPQLQSSEAVERLVIAARNVAFGLQTPITDPDDFALFKELDAASEAFASDIPWDGEPK